MGLIEGRNWLGCNEVEGAKAMRHMAALAGMMAGLMISVSACAMDSSLMSMDDLFLSIPPEQSITFNFSHAAKMASYCPDNTCEVVRVPAYVSMNQAKYIFAAYLFLYSDYFYLKDWKMRNDVKIVLYKESEKYTDKRDGHDIMEMRCKFLETFRKNNVKIFFVRHDEGFTSRKEIASQIMSDAVCKKKKP